MADLNPYASTDQEFVDFFGGEFQVSEEPVSAEPGYDTMAVETDSTSTRVARYAATAIVIGGSAMIATQNFYNFRHPGEALQAISDFVQQLF